ncbi:hypothetical protein [Lacticaseibacillus sharpeae]|uniref:Ribbon-helix-helix protein CopG domain-containing protein n=1 Tax=Lacticaseibacillus sharpeae JCM 1186 = DSM 20505 TaxID=1291052 RepID=A0A0R1ZNJ7_9LACO|nr:hypothetical protein [Lacticaseibacillus sharpeae]KRM56664.1 hypothetical protein FC18_GL001797 [Lacticaseibacillus sharpeae JCM 1186 = DSM 20505]
MQKTQRVELKTVPSADIAIIDERAAAKSKTRSAYITELIHQHCVNLYVSPELQNFAELAQKNVEVIEQNTAVIDELNQVLGGK